MLANTETAVTGGNARRGLAGVGPRALVQLEQNGTLVLVVCASVYLFVSRLHNSLAADSWMVLLSGREIAQHGLPSHDSITIWAHGRPWVDQQWLAQLTMYSLQRLGGLRLVMLAHAALSVGGFAAACAVARRRGASALSVTWIGALSLFAYYPEAVTVRAQSFAYVLFVAVFALLLGDGHRRSRRVYLVFPLLALWANLHGSVVVGAALVSLYGLIELLSRGKRLGPGLPRALLLTLAPWGCVLASPYGTSLPSYYRWILFDVHFNRYITEWAPTSLSRATAALYLLVIGGAWMIGRTNTSRNTFAVAAYFGTAILSLQAERNMPWFGLCAVLVLPSLLDHIRTPAAEPRRANRILAGTALVASTVLVVAVAAKSDSWFLHSYPPAAANAAAAAAGANGHIFANEAYADWLVWEHPKLAGRIAFDARFELLSPRQLAAVQNFRAGVVDWRATVAGYDVLVLSTSGDQRPIAEISRSGAFQPVADYDGILVLRRTHAG